MNIDFNKNYYGLLGISFNADKKEVKRSYYSLSKKHHPDKGGDSENFRLLSEAYDILMDEDSRKEYDTKSKWGSSYDELTELLNFEFNNLSKVWDEDKYEDFKKKEGLNIIVYIDDTFNGEIEYERLVVCKTCKGSGKDTSTKIEIKDINGNIKYFEGDDGCDLCEGTGKDYNDQPCFVCKGLGKVGLVDCKTCKGEKRILGKQKLSGIKIPPDSKDFKVDCMGHFSNIPGKVGHLWLVRKKESV